MTTDRKSFDFRMSKKVAELTQVVHMLFTRNHEKEIEIEALKDAYEDEIDRVIKDAKDKITDLEKQMNKLSSQTTDSANSLKEREEMENIIKMKEEKWKQRLAVLELQFQNEKLECQKARDLLIQAQQDMERLRDSQSQEVVNNTKETNKLNREIDQLKSQVTCLEKQLQESPTSGKVMDELHKSHARFQKEFAEMKSALLDSEERGEQLVTKNKLLDEQVKELKKELDKRNEKPLDKSASPRQAVHTKASILVSST